VHPNAPLAELERKRSDLLRQAAQIFEAADGASRKLTTEEDSNILELTKQAQSIEAEMFHLKRYHAEAEDHPGQAS